MGNGNCWKWRFLIRSRPSKDVLIITPLLFPSTFCKPIPTQTTQGWSRGPPIGMHWYSWVYILFLYVYSYIKDFPGGSLIKNPPAMQKTQVWSLGWKDPMEKEMATHSSILPWKILWTEEPGRLVHGFCNDWATKQEQQKIHTQIKTCICF